MLTGKKQKTDHYKELLRSLMQFSNKKVLFVNRKAARGDSPTLKLEIQFVQNKVRAAITALSNKEERETELAAPKFERSVLQRNVNRIGSLDINMIRN